MYSTYPTISKSVNVNAAPCYDDLVQTLRLIEHATAPSHDDGAYHEAAHDLATGVLKNVEGGAPYRTRAGLAGETTPSIADSGAAWESLSTAARDVLAERFSAGGVAQAPAVGDGPTVNLRKLAEQTGISMDLWDMGAASHAYSFGVNGITREHLEKFAAAYGFACWNAALEANPPNMNGFVSRAIGSLFEEESAAARDVLAERRRQISAESWTPEHDDEHSTGELASAAAAYANASPMVGHEGAEHGPGDPPDTWPWDIEWWKPGDQRRMLVKAGALILAEIERLDRAAMVQGGKS